MKTLKHVGVLAVFLSSLTLAIAVLCNHTTNSPCNPDFGLKDYTCPTIFTEFDPDYEWRSAGPNCNECSAISLQLTGGKDDCESDGPTFKCDYQNTITWCDGTTDDPYPVWQWIKPTRAAGNNCPAG